MCSSDYTFFSNFKSSQTFFSSFSVTSAAQRDNANTLLPSPPDLEFFTGARRHGSNTPVLQETCLENVLTATIVLTSTLVVLEVTSVI